MNAFHDPILQAYALSVCAVVATLYFLGFQTARVRAARKIAAPRAGRDPRLQP